MGIGEKKELIISGLNLLISEPRYIVISRKIFCYFIKIFYYIAKITSLFISRRYVVCEIGRYFET